MIYVGKKIRERLVALMALTAIIEEFKEDEARYREMFGKRSFSWLKQAASLITKAFHDGLSPNVGTEESERIHNDATKYRVYLVRLTEKPPLDHMSLPADDLYELGAIAIGKQCTGCTIQKHKECPLYQILHKVEMPEVHEEKGKCPYVQ